MQDIAGARVEREYDEDDRQVALQDRFEIEREQYDDPTIEVVMLGAPSREVLERTHSRYFKPVGQAVRDLAKAL